MASFKGVDLTTTYQVGADVNNIILTVKSGNGNNIRSVVLIGDVNLKVGVITGLPVGNAAAIRNKTLQVISIVNNTNPADLNLIVTYIFNDGATDTNFTSKGSVDSSGDTMVFTSNFNLK